MATWHPAPFIVAHPTLFTADEIELYERHILERPDATEHDASHFFADHPKFLLFGSGAEIRREVVLSASEGSTVHRVDFFRREHGETFWDVVELKTPKKEFATAVDGLHPRPSSSVIEAVNQAEDYRDLLIRDAELRESLLARGIAVCRPQITVIVGRRPDSLSREVEAVLKDRMRKSGVVARSYTDILEFAKSHYQHSTVIVVPVLAAPSIGGSPRVQYGLADARSILSKELESRLRGSLAEITRFNVFQEASGVRVEAIILDGHGTRSHSSFLSSDDPRLKVKEDLAVPQESQIAANA